MATASSPVTVDSVVSQAASHSQEGFRSGQIRQLKDLLPKLDYEVCELYTQECRTGPTKIAVCSSNIGTLFRVFLPNRYSKLENFIVRNGGPFLYISIEDIIHHDYLNDRNQAKSYTGLKFSRQPLYKTTTPVSTAQNYFQPKTVDELITTSGQEGESVDTEDPSLSSIQEPSVSTIQDPTVTAFPDMSLAPPITPVKKEWVGMPIVRSTMARQCYH